MRAIFLIALRNLTYRPGRSISCALGIALGLAIVMAVLIVDRNTILTQYTMRGETYGEPDVEIKPLRPNPALIEEQRLALDRCESIHAITALFFDTCRIRSMAGVELEMQLCGLDERASSAFEAYRVEEGEDLGFFGPPNLLLSARVARKLKVAPGDVVRLWHSLPKREICKEGRLIEIKKKTEPEVFDFRVAGVMAEEHLGARTLAVVPFSQGIELFEGAYILPIFWAKISPGFDLIAVQNALKETFSVDKPFRRALVGESLEERAFRNGVRLCALLSLLLGLYIIFNSMSMSLVERIRQIGLLRAMGITRSGLAGLFLLEGFVLTLAGCVLSVGLTAAIVAFMKWKGITTLGYGMPMQIIEIPWFQLACVMALGVFFALLGVVYPIGKASSLSVIQAIRKGTVEFERRPFQGWGKILFFFYLLLIPTAHFAITPLLSGRYLEMFLLILYTGVAVAVVVGLLLFFPPLLKWGSAWVVAPLGALDPVTAKLARSSMQTARLRVFSTVSGLALVFAAIFVIYSVTRSLLSETAAWSDDNLVSNIFVRVNQAGAVSEDEFQAVEGVEAVTNLSATIDSPFPVRGLAPRELVKFGPFEGRTDLFKEIRDGNWIIVSSRLSKVYNYQVNDALRLSTPEAGQKVFRVYAVSDEYGFYPDNRSFAVISAEKMASYFCVTADSGQRWSLHLKPDASPETVARSLKERLGDRASVTQGTVLKEEYLDDLERNFAIFTVIISLVALLSGISILNSLVIAVVERRRETALLRVVGLTPGQLKSILLLEAYSLGVLGGLFGMLLGWPLTVLTIEGLKKISYLDLQATFRADAALITFLGALLISLGASLYPIVRQGATDLMEAVKYE